MHRSFFSLSYLPVLRSLWHDCGLAAPHLWSGNASIAKCLQMFVHLFCPIGNFTWLFSRPYFGLTCRRFPQVSLCLSYPDMYGQKFRQWHSNHEKFDTEWPGFYLIIWSCNPPRNFPQESRKTGILAKLKMYFLNRFLKHITSKASHKNLQRYLLIYVRTFSAWFCTGSYFEERMH